MPTSTTTTPTTTSAKDGYLILYNCALTVGWAMVWGIAVHSLVMSVWGGDGSPADIVSFGKNALARIYIAEGMAVMLDLSQTMALLEIVHAATGLVRSPVLVTFLQVMSRIAALLALVGAKSAQSTYVRLGHVRLSLCRFGFIGSLDIRAISCSHTH